ncbi:replication restart DNA helicase PriA [Pilibacter termitis]|uniref:Replication restart DNA helicase PriA n=1 Tax=Pilibacter termitis TaxID=263852 RepID=A0A1T4MQX1_9ENTE|nr:DNA/RNA helicase domain-containing protein [Pilibacter termitis]SJZ69226.1 replication restart DNA helicase PriA [Pilibacter termitis]
MDFLTLKKGIELCEFDTQRIIDTYGVEFKNNGSKEYGAKSEAEVFYSFISFLLKNKVSEVDLLLETDYFNFGYVIPQIGKEFDLLRIGENSIVNIELKSSATEEKMLEQLKNNYFYLTFLGKPIYFYSFSADTETFIKVYISKTGEVEKSEVELNYSFIDDLKEQKKYDKPNFQDYNLLFNIDNYLVSPFNDVEDFYNGKYLLTKEQQQMKKEILKGDKSVHMIEGKAGTGKSLLLYDIAKELISNPEYNLSKVKIFHCGYLNKGHEALQKKGFDIRGIKSIESVLQEENFDFLLIDETQRLKEEQFKILEEKLSNHDKKFIFSIDSEQTLKISEDKAKIKNKLLDYIQKNGQYKRELKEKRRNNISMRKFIQYLFSLPVDLNEINGIKNNKNEIQIKYFDNYQRMEEFICQAEERKYTSIRFTADIHGDNPLKEISDKNDTVKKNSHRVIGQEFDNVLVMLDQHFEYRLNEKKTKYGICCNANSYYSGRNMLFQNISRVRKKLLICIVNNEDMFEKISSILTYVTSEKK